MRRRRQKGFCSPTPTTGFTAAVLAAEIGVIDLDSAFKHIHLLTRGHCLHQFVLNELRRWITHPEGTLERECRKPGFGLTDEVDRQEPQGQRQFAALHHGARDQRSLMATGRALEQCMGTSVHPTANGSRAARTTKALRPARLLQSGRTLCFSPELLEKLRQRQAELELNTIHGHGVHTLFDADYAYSIGGKGAV